MSSKLHKASWILLLIVGVLLTLASLVSATVAYTARFGYGGVSVDELAGSRTAVLMGLRGARGTAAGYALSFALLHTITVLGPYRKGERWAWWALLAAALAFGVTALARVPLVGISLGQAGTGQAMIQTSAIVLGLLLDVGRIRQPSK